MGLCTNDGNRIPVIVPSRYYTYRADGRRYSVSAMVDFIADNGFDGLDLSLDTVDELHLPAMEDDAWRASLYALGNRAAAKGLTLPVCHLPFAMPAPDDQRAMARFARSLSLGLDAAALLQIPTAVIHPIVRHSSRSDRDRWFSHNVAYLSLLRKKANRLGITLALENMTGIPYPNHPTETVYGCCAADIRALADKLDVGVCWDTGHAHLTGLAQSPELITLSGRLRMLHLHDNDGRTDSHLLPFEGTVDWEDVARGLRALGFTSAPWRCINLEIKSSHLPADPDLRRAHAQKVLAAARRLAGML